MRMKFSYLAEKFRELEGTTKRLEMTDTLAEIFGEASPEEIDKIIYLTQGQVKPPFKGIDIGLGEKYVQEAIATATGYSKKKVKEEFDETGDLGEAASKLKEKELQQSLVDKELTVKDVYKGFMKIATASGEGSEDTKIKTMAELLNNATPLEAKYITRIPINKLRLGIGDPTVMDSLSVMKTGDKELRKELQTAYNKCSDLGKVAKLFLEEGIEGVQKIEIEVFNPIRPALAKRLKSEEEIIEKHGETAVEGKYDGFRLECHKKGKEVKLFSRRLDDMTNMFPELVEAIKELEPEEIIFEGEAMSYNEEEQKFRPFQETMRRRRKYEIDEMAEKYPLKLFVFDIMYLDGEDYTKKKYMERREKLEEIFQIEEDTIRISDMKLTKDPEELEEIFREKVAQGLEGIMAKDPEAPYKAGSREWRWIKLKKSYEGELTDTIDLLIAGYYEGKGSRTQFGFGGLLGCIYNKEKDRFETIARIGTGFTEEQMKKLHEKLSEIEVKNKPARIRSKTEPDHWIEPKYVVTINADEITKSPKHTAGKEGKEKGYALRFPRLEGWIREDKKPEDATTLEEIEKMYKLQQE